MELAHLARSGLQPGAHAFRLAAVPLSMPIVFQALEQPAAAACAWTAVHVYAEKDAPWGLVHCFLWHVRCGYLCRELQAVQLPRLVRARHGLSEGIGWQPAHACGMHAQVRGVEPGGQACEAAVMRRRRSNV